MKDWKKVYSKDLRDLKYGGYSDKAIDHFISPRNVGTVENADVTVIVGDPSCGDFLELSIRVEPETEILDDVKFRVFGCGGAITTASALTEMAKGKKLDEAMQITDAHVITYLGGIPEDKRHCSLMATKALKAAISRYLEKKRRDNHPRRKEAGAESRASGVGHEG